MNESVSAEVNGARVTIEEFLRFLLRNALLLVVAILVGAAAGYGYSHTKPEVFEASALGYVSASGETDPDGNAITQASSNMQFQYDKAQSYLPLFNTRAVGQNIVDSTGLPISPDAAAASLSASLDPNAPIITATATAGTSQQAQQLANAAVEAVAQEAERLETGGNDAAQAQVVLVPYQTANAPSAPIAPDRRKFLAIGAVAGLAIALSIAWLRARNDSRIRTVNDLERATGIPVLGVLPAGKDLGRNKGTGVLVQPREFRTREALRKLRTNLRFVDVDNPPRSVVVTSSVPAEGKSTVAANLARVIAASGQRTLLIDADMRRPVLAAAMEVDDAVGLSQLLVGSVTAQEALQRVEDTRLWVLPAGQIPPNPSELLGSRRMHDLVAELSERFFVIIDAPPVLAVTDAQLLSRHTDGAILVSVPGRTRAEGIRKAVDSVQGVGSTVYGLVMNRVSTGRLKRIAYGDAEYGYSSYGNYTYGASKGYAYAVVEPDTDAEVLPDAPAVAVHEPLGEAPGEQDVPPAVSRPDGAASPVSSMSPSSASAAPRRRRAKRAAMPIDSES